jgi:hypothetical protein
VYDAGVVGSDQRRTGLLVSLQDLGLLRLLRPALQCPAANELHHDVHVIAVDADVVDRHDVGM